MILLIDNYDSFTYNLAQLLATLGAEVRVERNDAIGPGDVLALAPAGVVVSPGPSHPDRAGNSPAIVRALCDPAAGARIPVLGVCLGHQVIARVFGAAVERAPVPVHGKPERVEHDGGGVFAGVETPFEAARYHSLAVVESTLPPELVVSARSADDVIMGIRHVSLPVEGVQFHPESILTPAGPAIVSNFLSRTVTHA